MSALGPEADIQANDGMSALGQERSFLSDRVQSLRRGQRARVEGIRLRHARSYPDQPALRGRYLPLGSR